MAFDKFWFLNFVGINIENFADINFAIAVIELYIFDIQSYPPDCELFGTSFLKFMCPGATATLLFEFIRTFENN